MKQAQKPRATAHPMDALPPLSQAQRDAALARLQEHAATHKVEPPTVLLSCDGSPAASVLDYCATHGLALDWVYAGGEPQHRPELTDVAP